MGKPAARVGDMHVCPMVTPTVPPNPHVGGPVLPPGKPLVLIGGMPAATVGDMCTCVGPPDVIIQGSMSVLIGGMPAARMGDMTSHGGRIVIGCPTVLIGDFGMSDAEADAAFLNRANSKGGDNTNVLGGGVGGNAAAQKAARDAAKKARYDARLASIASGRERANALRAKPQYDPWFAHRDLTRAARLSQAADRLTRNNKAIERARLSSDVYNLWDKNGNRIPLADGTPPDGWTISESNFDKKTGFAYAVYESKFEKPSKPVLVFRGTQTKQDWTSNGKQAVGMKDDQYDASMNKADEMVDRYGPDGFEITGHSKAGGQTAAASIVTGAKGYGINSAGVHQNTVGRRGYSTEEATKTRSDGTPLVESYNFVYDPLSNVQDKGTPVLKGVLSAFPPTQPVGDWLTVSGAGPSAAGHRYVLPAVDEHGHPIPYRVKQTLDHHDPKMLIGSMEHEKQVDAQTLAEQ